MRHSPLKLARRCRASKPCGSSEAARTAEPRPREAKRPRTAVERHHDLDNEAETMAHTILSLGAEQQTGFEALERAEAIQIRETAVEPASDVEDAGEPVEMPATPTGSPAGARAEQSKRDAERTAKYSKLVKDTLSELGFKPSNMTEEQLDVLIGKMHRHQTTEDDDDYARRVEKFLRRLTAQLRANHGFVSKLSAKTAAEAESRRSSLIKQAFSPGDAKALGLSMEVVARRASSRTRAFTTSAPTAKSFSRRWREPRESGAAEGRAFARSSTRQGRLDAAKAAGQESQELSQGAS